MTFTGLVEEVGTIRRVIRSGRSLHLAVTANRVLEGLRIGDSIAVNGVCLTVNHFDNASLIADVMPETYERTNLRLLSPGSAVNLERALAVGDRLGGHLVQGHVDGVGVIGAMTADEIAVWMTVAAPPEILRYTVAKGSITVDGISLTVVDADKESFEVSLIPHTAQSTNMARHQPGDPVNLEVDILAKYVERLLGLGAPAGAEARTHSFAGGGLTEAFLREHGF